MTSKPLTLRLKAKNGQHVVNKLTIKSTLAELHGIISEVTSIPPRAVRLLSGYPPRALDASDPECSLEALKIRSGETLIVEEDATARAKQAAEQDERVANEIAAQMAHTGGGIMTRQVVPADNSCLFTSVNFAVNNGKLDLKSAPSMRELISSIVSGDIIKYNEAFLGRANKDYCEWIMNENSWGGAIEIAILSEHYKLEIDVVDTQTVRIDKFGEDKHYNTRILLLYDGVHYDPLMMEPFDSSESIKTVFVANSDSGDVVLSQALELAAEAKSSRQFTDTANFTLRCLICQKGLVGETGAQAHVNIGPNERAYNSAKAAAKSADDLPAPQIVTWQDCRQQVKSYITQVWQRQWNRLGQQRLLHRQVQ